MRDWLNAVLIFIGTTSMTDAEYAAINVVGMTSQVYNQAAYDQLSALLLSREAVSTMQSRLTGVFQAKGAEITAVVTAKTNIYLGDVL